MRHAKHGGEVGVNGETYKGGQFLPENPERAKVHGSAPRRARRGEIEPGVFAECPEGQSAIWQSIMALVDHSARRANPSSPIVPIDNPTAIEYYGGQAVIDRIAAYNRGERWFTPGV